MDLKELLTRYLGTGWASDVQQTGVRPDYGLSTATRISPGARSVYERTMAPGEQRSASDLQDMLAEVILAAGSAAVPGAGPKGQARNNPSSRMPKYRPEHLKALTPISKDTGAPVEAPKYGQVVPLKDSKGRQWFGQVREELISRDPNTYRKHLRISSSPDPESTPIDRIGIQDDWSLPSASGFKYSGPE